LAKGLSAALPLTVNEVDGPYRLNKNIEELAKQNLKMVLFTIPGEKVMDPSFGVGLSKYLFENYDRGLSTRVAGEIREQVSKYLPYVFLRNIIIEPLEENENSLHLVIQYSIPGGFSEQQLSLVLNSDSL
jgi:uncharacterized protein